MSDPKEPLEPLKAQGSPGAPGVGSLGDAWGTVRSGGQEHTLYILPYTLLGGAPHPPRPPWIENSWKVEFFDLILMAKIEKYKFQK